MTRFFVHKAWLGGAGVVAGVAGMATEWRPLVWIGVGLLAGAVLLRIVERRTAAP